MIKAKKSLSQNFLIDKNISLKIIKNITIFNKIIIEIGPGKGFLTDFIISEKPKKLILIEKDKYLANKLLDKYKHNNKIIIINSDILKFNFKDFKKINIIGNIPYNISSKIIKKIIINSDFISETLLMVQKEFAIKCNYKLPKMNKYKFMIQLCSVYRICFYIPPSVFIPKPKINSAMIKLNFKKNNIDWNKLLKFVNIIFQNKRKMIINKIKLKKYNNSMKILLSKRIEELNFKEVLSFYNFF